MHFKSNFLEEPFLGRGSIYFFCRQSNLVPSTSYLTFIAVTYKNLSFRTHFISFSRSALFAYKLPVRYLFPTTIALSTLLSPYLQYFGIYSDRQERQLIQVHTHFINRFRFHYRFQSTAQLPVQLKLQTLSRCIILEGCVFRAVTIVTVEPQCVCVPFVHLHRLTQLTAQ